MAAARSRVGGLGPAGDRRRLPAQLAGGRVSAVVWSRLDIAVVGIWQVVVSRRLARLAGQQGTEVQTADTRAADNALG